MSGADAGPDRGPHPSVIRARAKLRAQRGKIATLDEVMACVERMKARTRDPHYQKMLGEDRAEAARLAEAERQRWADRQAEDEKPKRPDPNLELRAEAQAMRDDGLSVRKIAEAIGRSVGWVAKHTTGTNG